MGNLNKLIIGQEDDLSDASQDRSHEEGVILDAYGRRRFMGVAGVAALGLLCSLDESEAGLFNFGYSTSSVQGIPQSWVQAKGLDVNRYANYIKGLRLRNITPRMVLAPHFKTRGRVANTLPPKSSWKKIGPTLKVIDRLSHEMGVPVKSVLSAYRSPRYNRAVRGKSRSYHMQNVAVDIQFHGASAWRVASVARYLRKKRKFEGGVGRYSSFVHIDTRGFNVDW
ncbi:DUF882 domain-containing protein [Verrucomicrobiaceae bacterium N1E253]|uniref:DUF882 domain-containing protein n=1 Tax=Oceaniferula marina TaxID=2748318 RepID=A0A851GBM8_9BACT|nr:D-Ala-D-Ala carboxypeptidase family metallohydrolase [Oceaniferula marina]NWK54579.1 DUF882 domain-containing protein [Oceaniferula marina]